MRIVFAFIIPTLIASWSVVHQSMVHTYSPGEEEEEEKEEEGRGGGEGGGGGGGERGGGGGE